VPLARVRIGPFGGRRATDANPKISTLTVVRVGLEPTTQGL
jgi:hypothetical protein